MSTITLDQTLALQVETVLRSLHIIGTRKGFPFLIHAVAETVRDPNRTNLITKDLYHEIARAHGTKAANVERDIRSLIRFGWLHARNEMEQLAGYSLPKPPTNAEFIDFVAFHIRSC